jgi:hypothetical protein
MQGMDEVTVSSDGGLAERFGHLSAHGTMVRAALVAAHGAHPADGFRATDVRFFFQLFDNWMESDVLRPGRDLELTQVRRALERLRAQGWAEGTSGDRRKGSRHRLTDRGLLGLVEALTDRGASRPFEEIVFVVCFAASYRDAIVSRVGGARLAPAARRRVAALLDSRRMLEDAKRTLRKALVDLESRIEEGTSLEDEARRGRSAGLTDGEIVRRLEALSPYQMHATRTLSSLLLSLPDDLRKFEIDGGIGLRVRLLFRPLADSVRAELSILDALSERVKDVR